MRPDRGGVLAEDKGAHCGVKSEGRYNRQNLDLTNRNYISGVYIWISLPNKTNSDTCSKGQNL